ncbi:hypothetical protein M5C72_08415 [Companilactobacillus allii]|uniref:Uncharacterized protein n=1 Tax=Companilactobacillus allii TaxID=1847728 RepID=A0A1P8Q5G7_9LACO|nr:hypothetical protein [Companilactobacillus allii]APX73104.1 hypothetical protein BTM29_11320 [Companilactobacillus allii]USQ67905.1 hypothetical protein M5C72_08415 [Companilactobacillus allii]
MPPHTFTVLGFTISDWVGIATITSLIIAAVRRILFQPLNDKLSDLSKAITELNANSNKAHSDLKDKIEENHLDIERHDIEIGFLYDKNNLNRRKKNEDK